MKNLLVLFYFLFTFCLSSQADHPNEGTKALDSLLKEAEQNNTSIKKAELSVKKTEIDLLTKEAPYFPQFSIEGGHLLSRFGDEKHSGSFLSGKMDWNLYRGGADRIEIQILKLAHEFELQKLNKIKIKIRSDVTKLYFDMLFILETIALKEKALQINSEQMKLAVAKKNSGFTSGSDVLEFELRDSTIRSDLILLNQTRDEKSKELEIVIGSVKETSFASIKGHLHRESKKIEKSKLLERLRSANFVIKEQNYIQELSKLERKFMQSDFYPKLDLEAQYGKLVGEERVDDENSNYTLKLKLTFPLFSGFETINSKRSFQVGLESSRLDQANQQKEIENEFFKKLNSIETLNQRLDIEEKNLSRSEDYYKMTLNEYKRGVKNSPDMVGAAERLLEARIRNLEFRRDLSQLYLSLDEMVGGG